MAPRAGCTTWFASEFLHPLGCARVSVPRTTVPAVARAAVPVASLLSRGWVGLDGCEVRLCDPCARVSRVCPGSPRSLFTGTPPKVPVTRFLNNLRSGRSAAGAALGMAASLGMAALVINVVAFTQHTIGIHTSSRRSFRAGVISSVCDAEISFHISYFAN